MSDDLSTGLAPAEGRWAFDESVADAFDDMLQRSIPNYEDMRRMVTGATVWFARHSRSAGPPRVVDLGASRGTGLQRIVDHLGVAARYSAYDLSAPMVEACREKFSGWRDYVRVAQHDLRDGLPSGDGAPAVYLLVLTLQFVPMEYRQRLVWDIAHSLRPGGALVIVEKVLGATAELNAVEVELYHDLKREHGYSAEAVDRKRLSLEGVLVPLTAAFNEELLRGAGFGAIDCVWAWGCFRGWIATVAS